MIDIIFNFLNLITKDFFWIIFQASGFIEYFWYLTLPLIFLLIFSIYNLFINKTKVNKLIILKLFITALIPFIIVLVGVIVGNGAEEPYSTIGQYINLSLFGINFIYQFYLFYTLKKFRLFIIGYSSLFLIFTFATMFTTAMYIADDWM